VTFSVLVTAMPPVMDLASAAPDCSTVAVMAAVAEMGMVAVTTFWDGADATAVPWTGGATLVAAGAGIGVLF
jgi:hypothetical protein